MWVGGVNSWDISGFTIGAPVLTSCLNILNNGNITITYNLKTPAINVDITKGLTLKHILLDDNVILAGYLTSTNSWDSVSGSINWVDTIAKYKVWKHVGTAAPSFTTRSIGAKLVVYPQLGTSTTDYASGVDNKYLWCSTASISTGHRWYCGISKVVELLASGVAVSGKFIIIKLLTPLQQQLEQHR